MSRTGAEIKQELDHQPMSAVEDAFRYVAPRDWRAPPRHPSVCPKWQHRAYVDLMGKEPPEPVSVQFDYNPRTKAGRELLKEMVGDANS